MEATEFLTRLGAAGMDHPGGTLLAHLGRVRALLAEWGARPALQLAGLCHAAYGTDGFPHPLLPIERREELAAIIGAEAEALVYRYGSCDRAASYPELTDGAFTDRFTGEPVTLSAQDLGDFAELTAANELDIVTVSDEFREQHGAAIRGLLNRFRPLLSEPAQRACEHLLP